MTQSGKTIGGMLRHGARPDELDRSYCGYLIPAERSETAEVTCKHCRKQAALMSEKRA